MSNAHNYWRDQLPYLQLLLNVPGNSYDGYEMIKSTEYKRPVFNNCVHRVEKNTNVAYTTAFASYAGSPWTRWVHYTRSTNPDLSPFFTNTFKVEEYSVFNASARAWWSMQPSFEGTVSVINTLFELKDFKDIVKFMFVRKGKTKNLFDALRHKARHGSPDPTRIAANLVLINNLAIQPTIKDAKSLIAQAQYIVQEVQEEFGVLGKSRQKSHYSEELDYQEWNITPPSVGSSRQTMTRKTVKFTATLEYKYNYTPRGAYEAFIKYWGLRGTPEAIWNFLPFSFVVDYFTAIGKSLNMMEVDRNVELLPIQYCESLLHHYQGGTFFVGLPTTSRGFYNAREEFVSGYPQRPLYLCGREGTHFERIVKRPNKSLAVPRWKNFRFSKTAQWNMLALIRCLL